MRNHTPPDESLARTTRQILAGGATKTPTLRTTAHRERPNHTTTQPRPHARALARARTRRRACHTPDTPCDSAQTALTQNTRAAHLATTRTKLEPNAHPPRRSSHPAHAIKRAAKQLTPRNGRHSGRDHRRPRPGAETPRRQPVPSRRTCKHTQVPTLREGAQWETAPSSPARANRQAPPARISAPRPHPHSSTPESGTRAETRALPTCATSHYSDRRNGHRRKARARLASSWAMPTRCRPLRAVAKREWTCRTICEHSRRNAHGRVTTLAVQHEVVTPSPATASDGGTGWARCDVECLVQTWLSRKSAPTGSPLQEHDVGVGRGEPSGVARIPAPAGKVRKSDIFGNL